MDSLIFTLLGLIAFVIVCTVVFLPYILRKHILPNAPKREIYVENNMWPLAVDTKYLSDTGQRIRAVGFKVMLVSAIAAGIILLGLLVFMQTVA